MSENTLIEELRWRGLLHDVTPGLEKHLNEHITTGYVGFDPTADSLHIGNFVPIMLLTHLQKHGHKPIALVGGATGMVGDPSGKTQERQLLSIDQLEHNIECIKKQLSLFLDFDPASNNSAKIVNNYDWFKNWSFLEFIREVGKHLSINYMLAKDSVKNRLETGMSFTEFSYQLIQGYDFLHLYKNLNVKLQMGGSDQWGNITTGTELIRRMEGGEAYALTAPLVTKADGSKFGKSEGGNIWLDKTKTSPYKFYQYWLRVSDADAENFIKIFSLKDREEIEALIELHRSNPSSFTLQTALASELTLRIHGTEDLSQAIAASQVLFGKNTADLLKSLNSETLLAMLEGVPSYQINRSILSEGVNVVELVSDQSGIFKSRGEARKMLLGGGLSINKEKIEAEATIINSDFLLQGKFILVQKGKKDYHLLVFA